MLETELLIGYLGFDICLLPKCRVQVLLASGGESANAVTLNRDLCFQKQWQDSWR